MVERCQVYPGVFAEKYGGTMPGKTSVVSVSGPRFPASVQTSFSFSALATAPVRVFTSSLE